MVGNGVGHDYPQLIQPITRSTNTYRPTQITDALGKLTRLAYDADGHLIRAAAQTGTQWLVSCRTYTASGKLLKAWYK